MSKATLERTLRGRVAWNITQNKDRWINPWNHKTEFKYHPAAPKSLVDAWENGFFAVQLFLDQTEWGEIKHLLISRADNQPIRSWTDLQRIKDELIGEEYTAVEVFPAKRQLIDQAHCYHLYVLPLDFKLPFGLHLNWVSEPIV